jgi:hypothetical protein
MNNIKLINGYLMPSENKKDASGNRSFNTEAIGVTNWGAGDHQNGLTFYGDYGYPGFGIQRQIKVALSDVSQEVLNPIVDKLIDTFKDLTPISPSMNTQIPVEIGVAGFLDEYSDKTKKAYPKVVVKSIKLTKEILEV